MTRTTKMTNEHREMIDEQIEFLEAQRKSISEQILFLREEIVRVEVKSDLPVLGLGDVVIALRDDTKANVVKGETYTIVNVDPKDTQLGYRIVTDISDTNNTGWVNRADIEEK